MLPVEWSHEDGFHYIDDEGAKALLKNIERLNSHIDTLESQIIEMESVLGY